MKKVNQAIPKIDAKALVTGKPVYTDDLAPKDCLIVKVLRSPHAHALIRNIDSSSARFRMRLPGWRADRAVRAYRGWSRAI